MSEPPETSGPPDAAEASELPAHRVELARSSRSRCRTCRRKIDKGTLRLGVLLEGPYGTGYLWHHLTCAARRRLEDVEAAYDAQAWDAGLELPDLDELRKLKQQSEERKAQRRDPPYVERAPTGRARCKHCGEPIAEAGWRVTLAREVRFGSQVRSTPIAVHAACVAAALRAEDCRTEREGFEEALRANSPELTPLELDAALQAIGALT